MRPFLGVFLPYICAIDLTWENIQGSTGLSGWIAIWELCLKCYPGSLAKLQHSILIQSPILSSMAILLYTQWELYMCA